MTQVDTSAMENALINLAINAREAMPGGGRLQIETTNLLLNEESDSVADLAPGEYVCISVTDSGSGIVLDMQ